MKRSVVQCHAVTLVTEEVWRPLYDTVHHLNVTNYSSTTLNLTFDNFSGFAGFLG